MKLNYLLALLVLSLSIGLNLQAQTCYPDPQYAGQEFGLYPLGPMQMDCGGLTASKVVVTRPDTMMIVSPDTIVFHFDKAKIDSVGGLPTGLTLETDVMNNATVDAPYGVWTNSGTTFSYESIIGCLNITGPASAWAAASTGGSNNDGVFPIAIRFLEHIDTVETNNASGLGQLFAMFSNTWSSTNGQALGAAARTFEFELRVNESACNGDISISAAVDGDDTTTPDCDGEVDIEVFYGVPPYTYAYSTGDSGVASLDSLCPGVYTVAVTDGNGSSGTYQFAVPADTNVYSNLIQGLPSWVDTLFNTVAQCDLDYSEPVDSFHIASATVVGTDTALINWVVYQFGQPYTVIAYYPYTTSDPMAYSLILYCQNGRAQAGVMQFYDYSDVTSVGIDNDALIETDIFPNPTTSTITLQTETPLRQAWLTDLTGRRLMPLQSNGNQWQADLSSLPSGMYLIDVLTQEGRRGVKKVVRE